MKMHYKVQQNAYSAVGCAVYTVAGWKRPTFKSENPTVYIKIVILFLDTNVLSTTSNY